MHGERAREALVVVPVPVKRPYCFCNRAPSTGDCVACGRLGCGLCLDGEGHHRCPAAEELKVGSEPYRAWREAVTTRKRPKVVARPRAVQRTGPDAIALRQLAGETAARLSARGQAPLRYPRESHVTEHYKVLGRRRTREVLIPPEQVTFYWLVGELVEDGKKVRYRDGAYEDSESGWCLLLRTDGTLLAASLSRDDGWFPRNVYGPEINRARLTLNVRIANEGDLVLLDRPNLGTWKTRKPHRNPGMDETHREELDRNFQVRFGAGEALEQALLRL